MNLADIIGRGTDSIGVTCVASLEVIDGMLVINEECDGWFGVEMNRLETQRLIDWLQNAMADIHDDASRSQ